ncbi:hypothetical protein Tco_1109062 [Tanacetum coccineum]
MNVVIRSNGQQRSFSTLMRVLLVFDREDLDAIYKLVMDIFQDKIPEVVHMLIEKKYPLKKEIVMQMLKLKLESEEESTMALELIRFIKKSSQLTLLLVEELTSPRSNSSWNSNRALKYSEKDLWPWRTSCYFSVDRLSKDDLFTNFQSRTEYRLITTRLRANARTTRFTFVPTETYMYPKALIRLRLQWNHFSEEGNHKDIKSVDFLGALLVSMCLLEEVSLEFLATKLDRSIGWNTQSMLELVLELRSQPLFPCVPSMDQNICSGVRFIWVAKEARKSLE